MDNEDQEIKLRPWGCEVKARTSVRTASKEVEFLRNLGRKKYISISEDTAYHHFQKPQELYQCLQHAYVFDFRRVVFLVADKTSAIINGTVVRFTKETLNAFGMVLKDLKDFTLSWAYDDHPIVPKNILDVALKEVEEISDKNCLEGTFLLWREMFMSGKLALPMPSLTRIIPAVHASWNSKKSGSDTTTKLMVCGLFCLLSQSLSSFNLSLLLFCDTTGWLS